MLTHKISKSNFFQPPEDEDRRQSKTGKRKYSIYTR